MVDSLAGEVEQLASGLARRCLPGARRRHEHRTPKEATRQPQGFDRHHEG